MLVLVFGVDVGIRCRCCFCPNKTDTQRFAVVRMLLVWLDCLVARENCDNDVEEK